MVESDSSRGRDKAWCKAAQNLLKSSSPFARGSGRSLDIGDELDDGNPLHHEAATPPGQNDGSPDRGQDELEL